MDRAFEGIAVDVTKKIINRVATISSIALNVFLLIIVELQTHESCKPAVKYRRHIRISIAIAIVLLILTMVDDSGTAKILLIIQNIYLLYVIYRFNKVFDTEVSQCTIKYKSLKHILTILIWVTILYESFLKELFKELIR